MSRRIAIVEDEAAIRENYADVLRKQGYEVQTYANRKEAMAAFDMRLPNLAIIDIGLDNEIDGGFTLCQALRSMSETLPIIFLTARDNDFDTVSGLRMGADDYLTKDISLPHLTARIAALFRRQDVIDQPPSPESLLHRGRMVLDIGRPNRALGRSARCAHRHRILDGTRAGQVPRPREEPPGAHARIEDIRRRQYHHLPCETHPQEVHRH
jgi:two-component system OmpR family response regulator